MTPLYAILGIVLILLSLPLGLMLAPLLVGAILLGIALRRADRALAPARRGGTASTAAS